ncbi:mechanosensitive ion channel domain-containing protein [Azospirillum halopraeferens]|uniref:mechanosensitive ion channel domain-containing protein n=1 Tax=Azospirillum halopraeferens TaxID=34010 RepID=UPI000417698A|nr:mechanosensitive ion channel domain-containing protein [Azospirillum halopraeferens]
MPRTGTRWVSGFAAFVIALLMFAVPPAAAQTPALPGTPAAPAAPAPAPADPGVLQIEAMIGALEDPVARARLVEQLRLLLAARGAAEGVAAAETAQAPPETLGARALAFLAQRLDLLSGQVVAMSNAFADLPGVLEWARRQMEDPSARDRWVQLIGELLLIVTAGLVVQSFIRWLLHTPRRAIEQRRHASLLARIPFLVLRALIELAPVVAFGILGYGLLTVSAPAPRVRLVALAFINATVIVQAALVIASFVFAPTAPGLRLLRMRDETAAYAYIWVRRLLAVGVFGYFLTEGAYVLGLPLGAYGAVLKLLGLVIAVMLIILILQNRSAVAEWLRGNPLSGGDPDATAERESEGGRAVLRSARRRFADIWHVLAILYVLVAFGAWILNVYDGFAFLAHATVLTVLVLAVTRLLVTGVDRLLQRGFSVSPDWQEQFPGLEERANRYVPILHTVLKTAIWVVAAASLLDAWGIDATAWLATPAGQRVLGSVVTIALVFLGAVVAWETVSAAIEHYLLPQELRGTRVERSARTRTLLPLLRNAFLVLLVIVVGLIILSELGVNIAPLLAGAGVVGLAIGFGSQTLVKDVITGLFILFEDTISVGDVVDVGNGHSGVVEAISIRTIRLRDLSGSVHSIPFSSVTTIKNLTKDFSFAVFDVSVGYGEDPDRVIEVLQEIGAALRDDPDFRYDILEPLEVLGVDRFAESGVIIKARFKTRPLKQWNVGRAFNKRMKKRFDEVGITIPYPHLNLVVNREGGRPTLPAPAPAPTPEPGTA